jgi:hypothetical protein
VILLYMTGLVVQVGPWRNAQRPNRQTLWSGGSNGSNDNRRQVFDPAQLSGFTYDHGFSKPSKYAIPSVVFKNDC